MAMAHLPLSLVFFLLSPALSTCFRPVILVHGLLSDSEKLAELEDMILKAHPGTQVTSLNLYPGARSLEPVEGQVEALLKKVAIAMAKSQDGIHLVCHSQGGLLCRGVVERLPRHKIHSMILLGSPFLGQFGIPGPLKVYLPFLKGERESLTKWMYTFVAQSTLSFANYWRDPRSEYQQEYEKECTFLPLLDNNPNALKYNTTDAKQARKNFLRLDRVVLVGGKDDGVIIPWQSSIGGFYGPKYEIVPFKEQESFMQDWYGLRTMYNRGSLYIHEFSGVRHSDWHKDPHVFKTAIEKYLD